MNINEFKIYVELLNKENKLNIENYLLEKDYNLSLFLSNWAKEETPHLDKLIFKGGTLLTKNYLKYHRISEDLDFIHQDSNVIRIIPTKQRKETQIKNRIIPIINEIKKISQLSNLEFETHRTNRRYIILRNSRQLYSFKLYYKSSYSNFESFIKLEISFVEDFINKPKKEEIQNIIDFKIKNFDIFKNLTNYNLEKPILQIYPIEEIILEKIRATITREQFKSRDVFDLYLINNQNDVFSQNNQDIYRKLKSSPFQYEDTIKNIKNFIKEEISIDIDDILNLSLTEFDENDFIDFSDKLIRYLKQIAEKFLDKNVR